MPTSSADFELAGHLKLLYLSQGKGELKWHIHTRWHTDSTQPGAL